MTIKTIAEFMSEFVPPDPAWNGWKLDQDGKELTYPAYGPGIFYPVYLRSMATSAAVLDTIMQIAGKSWATDQCLAGLVRALDDILRPQTHLCSGGNHKTLTPKQLENLIVSA